MTRLEETINNHIAANGGLNIDMGKFQVNADGHWDLSEI